MNLTKNSRRGISIVEILICVGVLGLAVGFTASVFNHAAKTEQQINGSSALLQLRGDFSGLRSKSAQWMTTMRAKNSTVKNCFPGDTSTPSCPQSETITPQSIVALTQTETVSSTALWSLDGKQQITGSESAPLYYQRDGEPCTSAASSTNCYFIARGYMARQNSDPHKPGYGRFLIHLGLNPALPASLANPAIHEEIFEIRISQDWQPTSVVCSSGQHFDGVDPNTGNAKCSPASALTGAVVAFPWPACPAGWSPYAPAADRMIIGAGATYSLGQLGGATSFVHAININELPQISAIASVTINVDDSGPVNNRNLTNGSATLGSPTTRTMSQTGASNLDFPPVGGTQQPLNFSIMPPYLSLQYCVRN